MSRARGIVPLQSKVSLTLLLLVTAFVLVSFVVLKGVIGPAFERLENESAISDMKRVDGALATDFDNLEAITADWAPWDDIYEYVGGRNPGFRKSNLDLSTMTNIGMDLMAVYGQNGRLVWGKLLVDGTERSIDSLDILRPGHPSAVLLTQHAALDGNVLGYVNTNLGPMLISSQPIRRTDESGPVGGAVVLGQHMSEARLEKLQQRTEVDVAWWFGDDVSRSRSEPAGTHITMTRKVGDIHGNPLMLLQTSTPRRISALGSRTINVALGFLIAAGVVVSAFIWFMLRTTILRPIVSLTRHIDRIRISGDLSQQLAMYRNDEIGMLARQFDSLTAEVHNARQALLEQSFKAGKADTAAEVLHNIRNAMTPMINGLERLRKAFSVTDRLKVKEATSQLGDESCSSDRRQKYLQYIDVSFDHVRKTGEDALCDLKIVTSQARQVEGILSDQERFANVAPVAENLTIAELADEAAHVIPREDSDEVALDFDSSLGEARVAAHRIGLLQVMGNLILNAYESICRSGMRDGKIRLRASDEVVGEKPMVRVVITDNGAGFDDETGEQIFRRGFTSKEKGNASGLGLHWCANAVAGMGGEIFAESAGIGRGAEFHVLLPQARGN